MNNRISRLARFALALALSSVAPTPGVAQATPAKTAPQANLAALPLHFEANRGQFDARVNFAARGEGYGLFLTPRETVLSLNAPDSPRRATLRMRLKNARPTTLIGADKLAGKINYLVGEPSQWKTDVPAYARVRQSGVWPGIDAVYYGQGRQLEYDFIVAPGADARAIQVEFDGARSAKLNARGELVFDLGAGRPLVQRAPVAYQIVGGKRVLVPARTTIKRDGNLIRAGFKLGKYNRALPLVIDPTLVYSTFLGGGLADQANGIAVDGSGSAYVVGTTSSIDLPTTTGALQTSGGGAILFKTTNGGTNFRSAERGLPADEVVAIVVSGGAVYASVASSIYKSTNGGASWSEMRNGLPFSQPNVLVADPRAANKIFAGFANGSVYVTANGGANWTSVSSGLNTAAVQSLAIDPANSAILYAGKAGNSAGTLFKTTNGGAAWTRADTNLPARGDVRAIAINPRTPTTLYAGLDNRDSASRGVWKSVNGGASWTLASNGLSSFSPDPLGVVSLVLDKNNPNTLYAGARGNFGVFKTTDGAANWTRVLETTREPVLAIDPSNSSIVYAGNTAPTNGGGDGIFKTTNAGANWSSTGLSGPSVTALAIDPAAPATLYAGSDGNRDNVGEAFVAKLNAAGNGFAYLTYLGGGGVDSATSVMLQNNRAVVVGSTTSVDFPTTANAYSRAISRGTNPNPAFPRAANADAFVARLSADGSALEYGTYLGGSEDENALGVAAGAGGTLLIAGSTESRPPFNASDSNVGFPLSSNAFRSSFGPSSGADGFLSQLDTTKIGAAALVYSTFFTRMTGLASDRSGDAYLTGQAFNGFRSSQLPTTPNAYNPGDPNSTAVSTTDAFLARVRPGAASGFLVYSTFYGGSGSGDTEIGNAVAVAPNGTVAIAGDVNTANLPLKNAFQTAGGGGTTDGFVAVFDTTKSGASGLLFASYIGGDALDSARAATFDDKNNLFVAGTTRSANFPVKRPLAGVVAGFRAAFVAKIDASKAGDSSLLYSAILGGEDSSGSVAQSEARGVAADANNNVFVAGLTSADGFPVVNAAQARFGGVTDGFVAKIFDSGANPDVSVTKTASASSVTIGNTVTFTLTARNNGGGTATSLILTDILPEGLDFVAATPTPDAQTGRVLTFRRPSLAINQSFAITVVARATTRGNKTNVATIAQNEVDSNGANNRATATVVSNSPLADLQITAIDTPDPVIVAGVVNYAVTVVNRGPATATNVRAIALLPPTASLQSSSFDAGTTGTIRTAGSSGSANVNFNIASLAPNATAKMTLKVQALAAGTLASTFSVRSTLPDSNLANNTARVATQVLPISVTSDVAVTQTPVAPVAVGARFTLTLNAINNGPKDPATNVTLTHQLPDGLNFISSVPAPSSNSNSVRTYALGNLARGVTRPVRVTVEATRVGTFASRATVKGVDLDPATFNNSNFLNIVVTPLAARADLSVTTTASATNIAAGGRVTYTLRATNNGPATATGVRVADVLGAGATLVSSVPTATSSAGNTLTFDIGNLAAGATRQISVTVNLNQVGNIGNTARIESRETDPNRANNSFLVNVLVAATPPAPVQKPSGPSAITAVAPSAAAS